MSTEKEVTIYDIARTLNISPATVSRGLQDHPAISKKTKKKIFDLASEIGYRSNHFARNLRQQKTMTLGVIVPRLNSQFMSAVIAGMEEVANAEGYNLIISQASESSAREAANSRTMFNNRVDGLLVSLAYDTRDLEHFDSFFRKNTPVIFFDRVLPHDKSTGIAIDNRKAAYELTRHLIGEGCRRIVHITAPSDQNVYRERLRGYQDALAEARIRFVEDRVIRLPLSMESGSEAALRILGMKARPDGVFAANDQAAVGCLLALKKQGIRIPEDMAVAGFNNDSISIVVEPNLTTIDYPGYEMGAVAARHLINHLSGIAPVQNTDTILLRSDLVIRDSTLRTSKT